MIRKEKLEIFGKILMFLGFIIIIFNAVIYLFRLWFSWSWLSLIGLVLVIIGMRLMRISRETKKQESIPSRKISGRKK